MVSRITLALGFGLLLAGCSRPPSGVVKTGGSKAAVSEDSIQTALDTLSRATNLDDYKETVQLLNKYLSKAENQDTIQLTPEDRQALVSFELDKNELEAVEARTFVPLDAHHLEACFLLRDAARAVEQTNLDPLEQARLSLAWVDRQVLLREGSAELLPPLYALRAGQGNTRERALVFLALLQQYRIPACVLRWPESEQGKQALLLVGVLGQSKEVFLFDPRMGQPVLGPEGIATLAQVRKDPKLLSALGSKSDSPPEVLLACPLSALSPRMKYLEDKLGRSDRAALAIEPAKQIAQVKAAAGDPKVWKQSLRSLPKMLPASDGGTDKNGRLSMFEAKRIPMQAVAQKLTAMKLLGEEMPSKQTQIVLLNFTQQLFSKYAREPHVQLLKGQNEKAIKRLQIMNSAFVDLEFSPLPDFGKRINDWREAVIKLQLAVIREERGAKKASEAMWSRDQYLLVLVQGESPDPAKHPKEEPSHIVLTAVKDSLGEQTLYLLAEALLEKAERSQATWERLKKAGKTDQARRAKEAWSNTRDWWKKYVERSPLAWSELEARFRLIQRHWQIGHQEKALNLWDVFVSELHRAASARLFLARAYQNLGEEKAAITSLADLQADLTALLKNTDIKEELASAQEKVRGQNNLIQTAILEDLAHDLGPDGGFHWLRERARRQLEQLNHKK